LWEPDEVPPGADNFYSGTRYIDEIYKIGVKLSNKLFDADHSDLRALSGHIADLAALISLTSPGDTIYSLESRYGGYPGLMPYGIPRMLSLRVIGIPFNEEEANIDVEALEKLIKRHGGRLIILGSSFLPFRHPIDQIARIAEEHGLRFVYDGSHVLGLIAGGAYPNPLKMGADAIVGSTHKSFPGPQGGIIATTSDVKGVFEANIVMRIVDNPHYNRVAALVIAISEMLEFGKDYARQIILNARRLATALHEYGLPIKYVDKGFTETHQVILGDIEAYSSFVKRLEKANIIVDYGKRLGTCEVTRLGMREQDMDRVAEYIYRVYKGEDVEGVRREVLRFMEGREVEYTFH
jgi:glycine hydroxymethyltransferase